MESADEPGRRTPAAIEQLQWSNEQADKRVVRKMEALINEFRKRVVRFLGIHHNKGRPRPEFERAERRLDLMVKSSDKMGLKKYSEAVASLHLNLAENYDKFALPIRLSLDEPGPGEEAMDLVSGDDEDVSEIYERLGG